MKNFFASISIVPSWLWIAFTIGIVVLILIDLSLFRFSNEKNKKKFALIESILWVFIALCFNGWFAYAYGRQLGIEFLTGYLVEKSLSVDNLFIILLIFSSFKIPSRLQHKVLFYGILGAIIMRISFILVGAHLLNQFHWILYLFGIILVITGIKLLWKSDKKIDPKQNWSIRILKRFIPTTDKFDGTRFFTSKKGGMKATPLFLALIAIEVTDLIFAIDSIPAVFAVTNDAFVAFGSNIFAILGLRALYFVLADWVVKLRYLKFGLAIILVFIGVKMLLTDLIKIQGWMSLLVILTVLIIVGITSWYAVYKEKTK